MHLQRVADRAAQAAQVARERAKAAEAERRLDAARVAHLQHARPAGRQRALRAQVKAQKPRLMQVSTAPHHNAPIIIMSVITRQVWTTPAASTSMPAQTNE